MKFRKSMLSASIAAALMFAATVQAQGAAPQNQATSTDQQQAQPPANKKKKKETAQTLGTIQVVGFRAAQELSLATKKAANSHVEVVSAIDIGKLPAQNVADTIEQLPGVNISDAAGAEGGFAEADRASLRGTAPSLTLTTVNGHAIASGDWFILGSGSTRSVSYSMLPTDIVNQVVVHESSEARLLEGGAAGSIDIITRKPLDFSSPMSGSLTVGGVYSDLAGSTKPQLSGLFNWKNSSNTFGAMFELFDQQQAFARDGQEMLGYSYITSGSAAAKSLGLSPATPGSPSTGVFYPNLMGAALFRQTRKRRGGMVDFEWKPFDDLTLNLNGFYSGLHATDYNYNYMLRARDELPGQAVTDGVIQDNVLTSAVLPGGPKQTQGIYDMISRPGESESAAYTTLSAKWTPTNNLSFKFQGGTTRGTGNTPIQNVMEMDTGYGQPASYTLNGYGSPGAWNIGNGSGAFNPDTVGLDWIFGEQNVHIIDKEFWFQLDGEYDFNDAGPLSSLQFGVRTDTHTHNSLSDVAAQGPNFASAVGNMFGGPFSTLPAASVLPPPGGSYPSNFANQVGVSEMPSDIWYWTPSQLAQLNSLYANRAITGSAATSRLYPNALFAMAERDRAAYAQINFAGDRWGGNFGLRWVSTTENIGYPSGSVIEDVANGPYLNSAFFPSGWYMNYYNHHYAKLLPSFNIKFDLNGDGSVLARFAASQTLTRQDYGQLANLVNLSDPHAPGVPGSGSGPNPYLKPLISTNFDASLEWYFSPRGLLSADIFTMDLNDYYDYGATTARFLNNYLTNQPSNPSHTPVYSDYVISRPVNVNGQVKGVQLDYIQPIGKYFGASFNYTYTNGHSEGGTLLYSPDGTQGVGASAGNRALFGSSKNTFNAALTFENTHWNARVDYTYRSKFYDGMQSVEAGSLGNTPALLPYWQAGQGYLSASVGYTYNKNLSFRLSGMNLNNPHLRYFDNGRQAGLDFGNVPEAFYVNGRQYYLTATFKFASAPASTPEPAAPPPAPAPVAAPPPPPPPQNVVIDLRGVNFKFDRPKPGEHNIGPTLKPPASESLAILNQAIDTLNRYPQVQIEIDGYTDSTGKPAYNKKLSDRRAQIVDDYLTAHGISAGRITAVQGFGEADPIDTNKTAAGRQRNRRVEFKVQGQGVTQGQQ